MRQRTILLVTFDLIGPGEPTVSFSVGSLLSHLRSHPGYDSDFTLDHCSFNLHVEPELTPIDTFLRLTSRYPLDRYAGIAVSCYVWSEYLVVPLISLLRNSGLRASIALGGYQIDHSASLAAEYPGVDVFIRGYAEDSLLRFALGQYPMSTPVILNDEPDFDHLESSYLTGAIEIGTDCYTARIETKRGCPYSCTFCAHRDLQRHKVYRQGKDKVLAEFSLLMTRGIRKINVVDPVFNMGREYLPLLESLVAHGNNTQINLQARIENIRGVEGEAFLDLCSRLNTVLEFGLQSANSNELSLIKRANNLPLASEVMRKLGMLKIPYEVSLIYGLPDQTVESFQRSIQWLLDQGCTQIKAFPLMLLKGTELWSHKDSWALTEDIVGPFRIPVVVESPSFTRLEWQDMHERASGIMAGNRYM